MNSEAARRTRILFYSHTGLISGAEHVLLNTLTGLDQSLFEPTAICPAQGELRSRLQSTGIPVFSVDALQARFTSQFAALLHYLKSVYCVIQSFRSQIRSLSPDVIHANSVRAGIVATIATVGSRTPIIWHVHDDLPRHPISTLIRTGAFLSSRSIFLSVSAATAKAFSGRLNFGKRIHVLYNGIDLNRFPKKDNSLSVFRDGLYLDEGNFLICAVGMINPRKDLIGLLEAFKLVHDVQPKAHLAIVGAPIFNRDDLYLEEVQRLSSRLGLDEVVHFTGPQKDVPSILRSSDLLVLNARVEPFGLVLIEAMSSGTPVMATNVGGIPEIVTDKETGFLVPAADPQALAKRILEVIANPEVRNKVSHKAHDTVCPRFSLERYSADYREILLSHFAPNSDTPCHRANLAPASGCTDNLKVALFHDNFAQSGGAERVAEELHRTLHRAYPDTDLLSTLSAQERLSPHLRAIEIRTTWMQRLPAKAKLFRAYFLLYPFAIDRVDLTEYDLVVTSCFGYAKGVRRRPGALHICYCHTPMRWVWRTEDYLAREKNNWLKAIALSLPIRLLKTWELSAASRPDIYLANSSVVADRLFQAFGIHATVIPPPIDTNRFAPAPGSLESPDDFYLILSRLVPYKRFDLAIEACSRTGRRLIVIGDGPDRRRLTSLAGPTVTFLGRASDEVVIDHAKRCRALLFPGEEDFGMTPLEINAAGRPVVAYRAGGATETIIDGLNGVFFDHPTADSMIAAIARLESIAWDTAAIQRHAEQYDASIFATRIQTFIQQALHDREVSLDQVEAQVNA